MSNEKSLRIPSLDGLRALSISLVLFGHLCGTRNFWSGEGVSFLGPGELGVRVFFVISGLLITRLLLTENETTGKIHLAKFYFRRTLRIFPPYYVFLFFLIAVQPLGWLLLNRGDALHALTYTSNYHLDRSWQIGHTWSLSVEEQFYLLWPATLLLLGLRRGLQAAALVLLLCPLIRLGLFHLLPERAAGVGHQFETVADAIATGCVLACQTAWPPLLRALYERLLQSRLMMLALSLLGLAGNSLNDHPSLAFLFGHTLVNLCIGVCLDWCVRNHRGMIGRLLNAPAMVFVGTISYSLYLWQQIFLNQRANGPVTSFPLNLGLTLTAGLLSYYLVEKPSLNLRQRLERRLFPKRAVPAAERALILPFEISTPSTRAERLLRLNALPVSERREEQPTESFLAALRRLEITERRATLSDALARLGLYVKTKK